MEKVNLHNVIPADYNPRFLSDDAKKELMNSIKELGCVKPILVNRKNNVIVAGHQRTKVMLEMGIEECDAFVLDGLNTNDEIRLNQLHNRCEYEVNPNAPIISIKTELKVGYNRVKSDDIFVHNRGTLAVYLSILCKLINKVGEFAAPICTIDGKIIVSSAYALASKILHKDIYVYAVPNEKEDVVLKYFSKDYGVFSYEGLEKHTYIQGLAQMRRLRKAVKGSRVIHSTLYERVVIPYLKSTNGKSLKILDFGAGAYDYARKLRSEGYDILAVDPYHMKEMTREIDVLGNTDKFRMICKCLLENGGYDIVICDSVLNSVDSKEAEKSVILTCKALAKIGATIFMSGRSRSATERTEQSATKKTIDNDQWAKFFDDAGFTALYRSGEWFYQRFHSEEEMQKVAKLLSDNGEVVRFHDRQSNFCIKATKTEEHDFGDTINALRFEFGMILPNGERYELQDEIEYAYKNRNTNYQNI